MNNWIYIEPFVFIWQDKGYYLFYNSLNGKKLFLKKETEIDPIIDALQNENNLYCVKLESGIEHSNTFTSFVCTLVENQLGNVVCCTDSARPVNIPPMLMLSKSVENSKRTKSEYFDYKVLGNIVELAVQVNGACGQECNHCGDYNLQLMHCSRSAHSLPSSYISNLIQQVRHLNLKRINILGGNIFALNTFDLLVSSFSSVPVLKLYNTHFKNIDITKIAYILGNDPTSLVRISIHGDTAEYSDIIQRIESLNDYCSRILWSFVVSSESELELCYSIIDKHQSIQYDIKPFYNGQNEQFIRDFVFIDNDEIQGLNPTKKQVFANQVINRNYYGSLTIQANGNIHDNLHFEPVGTTNDCLEDIVHRAIKEGNSWRITRSNSTCGECLYKYICPPPSNLELAMGLTTICQAPRCYDEVNADASLLACN